jgi:electron transfer flavoprotein beta subunit
MNILVLIKHVPHGESPFDLSPDGSQIRFSEHASYGINSYDTYALEEALLVSEQIAGTAISVATIGTSAAETSVRRALAMGAHEAYLIIGHKAEDLTPFEKAEILAEFCASRRFDIIMAGTSSDDSAHAALGPMLAYRLHIPWATHIISLETDAEKKCITAMREIDVATRQRIVLPLPSLIAVQSGINRPRYPSLSNTLRAKKQNIEHISLRATARPTLQSRFSMPSRTKDTLMLQGTSKENASALYEYLHAKSLL